MDGHDLYMTKQPTKNLTGWRCGLHRKVKLPRAYDLFDTFGLTTEQPSRSS